ncbi:MAG TPA: DNA replication and repair protein RecF [Blastocatellia bacterium]
MILDRLEALGFRNLEGSCCFGPKLNIFYGDNAQGKTNWLEAIYLLACTKSYRTKQLRDTITIGAASAIVRGEVKRGSLSKQQQIQITEAARQLFINGKRESLPRYLGNLEVFVFSMEGMEIIRREPAERRRFLDRGIVSITPSFLGIISQYNHVVRQKNKLLGQAMESNNPGSFRAQVEAWNQQLALLGTAVHQARVSYVDKLNRVLEENDHGRSIFGAESLSLRYRSQMEGKGDLADYEGVFRERLAVRLPAELGAGRSLIGPHRDEMEILADGYEIARFSSAGQQKSALFILDLAQLSIYNNTYEEEPVLLIDDVDAELDRGRVEAVLLQVEGRAQTFVTTSRRSIADRYRDKASIYLVKGGQMVEDMRM